MDESFGANSSPLDDSLLNSPTPGLMGDMSGEMDFLSADSGSVFSSLLPESRTYMASEVDFQGAATDFNFDFDTDMSYPEPMMNNGWNPLDPGLGASLDDSLIDPMLLISQDSSSLPVPQDSDEMIGFSAPLEDSSLFIPESCNEMIDTPDRDFGNFQYVDADAFATSYSHPVEDIVSESVTPPASAQPLPTIRSKYAHFSVPIDTPQDYSPPSGPPIFLRRSGVKLHRAQVQNPLPCLDEVGWHPGQQPPSLQFVYPPLTPPGQTSAADSNHSIPSASYRPRPAAQMVPSNSVDDEYFRLVEQHTTNKAQKSKRVSEINRTMKKAMANVVRAGAQQYSSITGKAVTPLPRKRTAVRTADGGVSLKTDNPAPLMTTRRGGVRKAQRKGKYVEVSSESEEVTDYEGEDSSSAGESDAECESEDEVEMLRKLPGNRKRSAERDVSGLRRSKRARRPAERMG